MVVRLQQARERLGLRPLLLMRLSPLAVLQRGYAIAQDASGALLRDRSIVAVVMKCAFVWRKEDSMRASKVSRGPMSFSNDMNEPGRKRIVINLDQSHGAQPAKQRTAVGRKCSPSLSG